jgi:hypothetical protein
MINTDIISDYQSNQFHQCSIKIITIQNNKKINL